MAFDAARAVVIISRPRSWALVSVRATKVLETLQGIGKTGLGVPGVHPSFVGKKKPWAWI